MGFETYPRLDRMRGSAYLKTGFLELKYPLVCFQVNGYPYFTRFKIVIDKPDQP
jgi:hypothetical protein